MMVRGGIEACGDALASVGSREVVLPVAILRNRTERPGIHADVSDRRLVGGRPGVADVMQSRDK